MFGKGVKLFRIMGFEVRIDTSWLLLAILIIVSLSAGYFPFHYEDLSTAAYVGMGVAAALGLFASIIFHELCHSLMARRFGIPMGGITLFMFGGVAQMDEEPRSAKGEFFMALAGPVASLLLAAVLYLVYRGLVAAVGVTVVTGVIGFLAWINVVLAFFNLLPAFPLDGGRLLRSAMWAWKNNLRWATRIASQIGNAFGIALIVLGVFALLAGNLIGGLWWCLIGMFLKGIAQGSYRQVVIRETLAGEKVRRFMHDKPVTVPPSLSVAELVEDYIYHYHFKMFPVVADGLLKGCVTTADIKGLDRENWQESSVEDIARECSADNTVEPDADATEALSAMNRTGNSRMMVVEDSRLVGIVSLKDLLKFLAVKLDLEDDDGASTEKLRRQLEQSAQ